SRRISAESESGTSFGHPRPGEPPIRADISQLGAPEGSVARVDVDRLHTRRDPQGGQSFDIGSIDDLEMFDAMPTRANSIDADCVLNDGDRASHGFITDGKHGDFQPGSIRSGHDGREVVQRPDGFRAAAVSVGGSENGCAAVDGSIDDHLDPDDLQERGRDSLSQLNGPSNLSEVLFAIACVVDPPICFQSARKTPFPLCCLESFEVSFVEAHIAGSSHTCLSVGLLYAVEIASTD